MVCILFFFLNNSIDNAMPNNSPIAQFRNRMRNKKNDETAKLQESRMRSMSRTKSKSKINTHKKNLNNIGNAAMNKYSKHTYRKKTLYGIDVISIVKMLPINNKFILMMLLSI